MEDPISNSGIRGLAFAKTRSQKLNRPNALLHPEGEVAFCDSVAEGMV